MPVVGLAVAELAFWAIAWRLGLAPVPMIGTYILFAFTALAAALGIRLAFLRRFPRTPWPALLAGTLLVALIASLFSALKFGIPAMQPFWLDPYLEHAERGLFGTDAWQLLDATLGWSTMIVDRIYGLWLPVQLTILFSVILAQPSPAKARALVSYAAAWLLVGVGMAALFSSAGPIFYDRAFGGARFATLHEALLRHDAWMVVATADGMWSAYHDGRLNLVSGISALPSMHVAISLWIALTARAMAPRLAPSAWVYFAFMWIASVQLGWHYASDGLAGSFGVALIWLAAGLLNRPRRPHSRPGSAPAP